MGAGQAVPLSEAGGAVDYVARMNALLDRHQNVTWLRPGIDHVTSHTASWMHVGRAEDEGKPTVVSRDSLAELVLHLEAVLDGRG